MSRRKGARGPVRARPRLRHLPVPAWRRFRRRRSRGPGNGSSRSSSIPTQGRRCSSRATSSVTSRRPTATAPSRFGLRLGPITNAASIAAPSSVLAGTRRASVASAGEDARALELRGVSVLPPRPRGARPSRSLYVLHNVAKKSARRAAFVARSGKMRPISSIRIRTAPCSSRPISCAISRVRNMRSARWLLLLLVAARRSSKPAPRRSRISIFAIGEAVELEGAAARAGEDT